MLSLYRRLKTFKQLSNQHEDFFEEKMNRNCNGGIRTAGPSHKFLDPKRKQKRSSLSSVAYRRFYICFPVSRHTTHSHPFFNVATIGPRLDTLILFYFVCFAPYRQPITGFEAGNIWTSFIETNLLLIRTQSIIHKAYRAFLLALFCHKNQLTAPREAVDDDHRVGYRLFPPGLRGL
jgi:hypothetical protein